LGPPLFRELKPLRLSEQALKQRRGEVEEIFRVFFGQSASVSTIVPVLTNARR
jgi:hypothetical protein